MKKMIVSAFMLATVATATFVKAAIAVTPGAVTATKDDTKTKIDPATLPDAVKATLASDAYKDWKVSNAWSVKADAPYYTIELKKDDKTNIVNIDANGKVI